MAIRLTKRWQPLTSEAIATLPGQLGVFELADDLGRVLYIGYAGGRSLFGLRSEVAQARGRAPDARRFRTEVTMQYLTRHQELLMLHVADHGAVPDGNRGEERRLGRLSPL
ncbi:MAG TPA: hypothetical protein VGU20_04410 [Stellaceae bacterium]|nr:hypothetical protein [Stellaceae bacterium]